LIEVEQNIKALRSKIAPEFTCEKCGKNLEFDALEESYFLFAGSGIPQAS
jgi:transcription initiation factor IIE alpha subunit